MVPIIACICLILVSKEILKFDLYIDLAIGNNGLKSITKFFFKLGISNAEDKIPNVNIC